MPNALIALGGAFLVAGLLARVGRRVGLPTIPFFMAAGIITGPHTPGFVLVEEPGELALIALIGLIMLLFHLGLEYSLDDLASGGMRLVAAGGAYLILNVGGGLVMGLAFGWGTREAFVIAGAVGISSSAIVTKLLIELRRLANRETRLILGIAVVQDVFIAFYLALLQPILGQVQDLGEGVVIFGRAFAFLTFLFLVARFGARFVGRIVASDDNELLTVLFVGVAILVAGLGEELGVSAAIGALMTGMILAETDIAGRIENLVLPLRDAFAAIFFFAFGLSIDPEAIGDVAVPVAAAVLVTFLLNAAAGVIGARMYGFGRRQAANVGLTLLGRGELSLILAALGASAGLDARVPPFVALYVLVLAIGGPLLATRSDLLGSWLPARLLARRPAEPAPQPEG